MSRRFKCPRCGTVVLSTVGGTKLFCLGQDSALHADQLMAHETKEEHYEWLQKLAAQETD